MIPFSLFVFTDSTCTFHLAVIRPAFISYPLDHQKRVIEWVVWEILLLLFEIPFAHFAVNIEVMLHSAYLLEVTLK